MRHQLWLAALAAAGAAQAQAQMGPGPEPARIVVAGTGSVTTPPDRATIRYDVHGEGATSDAALRMLVARRAAIAAGLATVAGRPEATTTQVTIGEVRSRECPSRYEGPRLSTGACAIAGYVADLSLMLRTSAVKDAGTIVGLIGRLGGTDPRLEGFGLVDAQPARRRATVAALADARRQAETIAQGTGARIGRLLSASNMSGGDRSVQDIVVTASNESAPPAPPPPPPPIAVNLTPQPIETQAQVTVTYEVLP